KKLITFTVEISSSLDPDTNLTFTLFNRRLPPPAAGSLPPPADDGLPPSGSRRLPSFLLPPVPEKQSMSYMVILFTVLSAKRFLMLFKLNCNPRQFTCARSVLTLHNLRLMQLN
ncbi:hypothetical protein V2J09_009238, partial [Rumex salicifolius]